MLGDHIRKVRIERGQHQSDLAKIFKVTTNTVTNWELNKSKIERIYLPILLDYLGYLPKKHEISELSYKLIRYRWEQEISIKKLAKKIGVYSNSVKNAEIGKLNFHKKTLKKISSFTFD